MKIGFAFDLAPAAEGGARDGPDDRFEEFDKPETIAALADVLRAEGHEVVFLGDGRALLEKVLADPPDLVWNMAEGEGIGRCREARVPAVLEMLGIPCTGSDPLTLAAALDKDVAKCLVRDAGAKVPEGLLFDPKLGPEIETILAEFSERVAPPWIVKPAFEGSSKGIRTRCLVDSEGQATAVIASLIRDYEQPILLEEFVTGDEVTVGIVGEGPNLRVIGAMRILPRQPDDRFVYSLEMKREWREKIAYEVPARLSFEVSERLELAARTAYQALGCRDVARIDFRVRDGWPYFIEANPLPGLSPGHSDLVLLADGYGLGHADLIRLILDSALRRLGLSADLAGASRQ